MQPCLQKGRKTMPDQTPLQDNPIQPSTSTLPDQIPASQSQPTAPMAPTSQAAPNAPQSGQPQSGQPQSGQPAAPASPAQAAQSIHGQIFQHVLSSLAGQRPVIDPNTGRPAVDANGTVVPKPGNAKTIGASILAGAISGLVAGWASPDRRTELGNGRSIADNSGAAAAGAAAGAQYGAKAQVAKAQDQADADQARAYATVDHNLKFHQLSVAADKADRENQQAVVDAHSSMNDAMDEAYANGNVVDQNGKSIDLYKQRGILGTEVQKLVSDTSLNITNDMVTPVSVIDVPNRNGDGGSHAETLFDVFNPAALVNMSDAIRKDNPRLTDVANGTPLPVRILASNALKVSSGALASSGLDNQSKAYNDAVKGTNIPAISDFDLASAAKKNPLIEKLYPYINKYRKDTIDAMFNDFQKDPNIAKDQTLQTASALLQQAMGVTPEGLQKMATQRADVVLQQKDKAAEEKAIAEANAKRLTPDGQADLLHKQLENQILIQSAAQAKAQGQGIQVPKNFTANPKANEMEAGALQSDLSAKGVDVPSNFGYSGEGEHRFRREAERHSGAKVNSSRSEATLAW
jgi:hypothetical protein